MKRTKKDISIAILGAGVAGLCQAIKLQEAGFTNIRILEKADDLGGTWRENSYPGCSCDVPMHMYQFSFALSPHWTKKFVSAAEIKTYLDKVADDYQLRQYIQYNKEVVAASFDERGGVWHLRLKDGTELQADIFIAGAGQLHRPRWPNIEGQESFQGASWHSAAWDHKTSLEGKRVGVIGNGASAIQFVPEIIKQIGAGGHCEIFQRSASWVLPRPQRDFKKWERALYSTMPWTMNLQRYKIYWQSELMWIAFHKRGKMFKEMAADTMKEDLADEEKQRQLTPDYEPGCKRVLFANDWWKGVAADFVKINETPIKKITPQGVETQSGQVPLDVLIYSTGFNTTTFLGPMKMTGLGGTDLRAMWAERGGAEAHLGMAVSGFPNFFMLYGPNTNLGHNSIIFMIECQANYITQCVQKLYKKNFLYMNVKPTAQETSNAKVQKDNAGSVFATGCASWYKTADGKVTNNWANHSFVYWWQVRKMKARDYDFKKRDAQPQDAQRRDAQRREAQHSTKSPDLGGLRPAFN